LLFDEVYFVSYNKIDKDYKNKNILLARRLDTNLVPLSNGAKDELL